MADGKGQVQVVPSFPDMICAGAQTGPVVSKEGEPADFVQQQAGHCF